jgi:hypothetical protein
MTTPSPSDTTPAQPDGEVTVGQLIDHYAKQPYTPIGQATLDALEHLRASQAPASAALLEALEAGARALDEVATRHAYDDFGSNARQLADDATDAAATLRRHAEGVKT